jgi:ubiquitin carboxyl-terminal hydrolase L3
VPPSVASKRSEDSIEVHASKELSVSHLILLCNKRCKLLPRFSGTFSLAEEGTLCSQSYPISTFKMSTGDVAVTSSRHWIPAESNDGVFTAFAKRLGWPTEQYNFQEVLSTEDWALEMIQGDKVRAVCMLYVVSKPQEDWRRAEQVKRDPKLREGLSAEEQGALPPLQKVDDKIFHCAQNIDNACATLSLIHACANLSTHCGGDIKLAEGSFLDKFVRENLNKTALERAEALDADDSINEGHEEVAQQGQSAVVDDTHNHFVCFVKGAGEFLKMRTFRSE